MIYNGLTEVTKMIKYLDGFLTVTVRKIKKFALSTLYHGVTTKVYLKGLIIFTTPVKVQMTISHKKTFY